MTTGLKVDINPYEGKPRAWLVASAIVLLLISFINLPPAVKVVGYIVFGLVFFVTGLLVLARFLVLRRGKWAKLHYPLMVRYATIVGSLPLPVEPSHTNADDNTLFGNQPEHIPHLLLKSVVEDDIASELSKRVQNRLTIDLKKAEAYLIRINPSITKGQLEESLTDIKEILSPENPRTHIAELVAAVFGEEERDRYIIATITGVA